MSNKPFASIEPEELALAAGGWNPFKSAWNEVKNVGHEVVNAARTGVDYVKQHPDILLQTSRLF